jgi:hypothetical protein
MFTQMLIEHSERMAQKRIADIAASHQVQCACVHPDDFECARLRDGRMGEDDSSYLRRRCECCCHEKDPDEEE